MGRKFRLGLQKGSLNNLERKGFTAWLLYGAGFHIKGYHPGEEANDIEFLNFPQIQGILTTSQRAPELLYDGQMDALIAGHDWIIEWGKRGKPNELVRPLGFGNARVVVAKKKRPPKVSGKEHFYKASLSLRDKSNEPFVCHTEFPYIAKDDIMQSKAYRNRFGSKPPLIIGATGDVIANSENNERVRIKHIMGHAEKELDIGADYIVECTQTGKSFRENNIEEVDEIMKSQAGLYARKKQLDDGELNDILKYFSWMMGGGVLRETPFGMDERMLVKANVRNDKKGDIIEYVKKMKFCDKGPTTMPVSGTDFSAIEMEMTMGQWPQFTYGTWTNFKKDDNAVTNVIRLSIYQSLP